MTRLPRRDFVGQWHHVMHRGIARRTVFETDRDVRVLLAHLARAVHAGEIEVHAFSVLTTHFHLLVRCPVGGLGVAIGRVLNEYVRWFNRGRQRDGSLFRGRFRSRPVTSEAYRRTLVRYIDDNPVVAGLVTRASEYPHGSAHRFSSARITPWLERRWVASVVADRADGATLDAHSYSIAFERVTDLRLRRFVERRFSSHATQADPLDELLGAAPSRVLAWMQRKAALADGTAVGLPVCDVEHVTQAVGEARQERGVWTLASGVPRSKPRDAWLQIDNGLGRELCAATCEESAQRLRRTISWSSIAHRAHRQLLISDSYYAAACADIASRAIELGQASR